MSWLTRPLTLLVGFLASIIAIARALRGLMRKIVLFPGVVLRSS